MKIKVKALIGEFKQIKTNCKSFFNDSSSMPLNFFIFYMVAVIWWIRSCKETRPTENIKNNNEESYECRIV